MVGRIAGDDYKKILEAKYEKADLHKEIMQDSPHLEMSQRTDLLNVLKRYETLFDGTLGTWRGASYGTTLKEGATPYHGRPYTIPRAYEEQVRLEVKRLEKIGVLRKTNRSEWGAPAFVIPKKDRTVRFITDFRELNKRILRKPYPIPRIQDLLLKLEGFTYAT